jgi:hypothetical protein
MLEKRWLEKYKIADVLVDNGGRIILVYAHCSTGHFYMCETEWNNGTDGTVWICGYYVDKMEKIGVL